MKVISTVLPYCDAIFVDNEMRAYLREEPLATDLNYGARVFSAQNRDEFLAYLDELGGEVSKQHLETVKRVYGEEWTKPFTTMFQSKQTE